MKHKIYNTIKNFTYVRITAACFSLCLFSISNAQFYSFSKTTAAYAEISGGNSLKTGNWDDFSVLFKTPFVFKFFTLNIVDSIEVTDWGGIYFNSINNGLFDFYQVDLNSRGTNKSDVSYKTEGNTPNRILKIQFHNAGFAADAPNFVDSINVQLWVYETSNILEFRYGPNGVKQASFDGEMGPYVQLADPLSISSNFIVLEGNPANPTLRTTNLSSSTTLTGTPANGTIYRFVPSLWRTGIESKTEMSIQAGKGTISLPPSAEIQKIEVMNLNGKIIQEANSTLNLDFSGFPSGIYIITVMTSTGILRQKIVL